MEERRKELRHRTFKAGIVAFNRDGGISCRVRNLSPIGACLDVASPLGVPEEFVLVIESSRVKERCHIVWRTGTRLGVAFNG